jgi:hypothetical protein
VEPSGIPVGETDEPEVIPSGEVAPIVGVGAAIALTCAIAAVLTTRGRIAAIRRSRVSALLLQVASFHPEPAAMHSAAGLLDAKLLNIGQSLGDCLLNFSKTGSCSLKVGLTFKPIN